MKNKWILTGIIILVMSIAACQKEDNAPAAIDISKTPPSLSDAKPVQQIQTLELTEIQAQELKIETFTVESKESRSFLNAPGMVFPAPNHSAIVSAPVDGRVVQLFACEGKPIAKGDVLYELESFHFAELWADYLKADATEKYEKTQLARQEDLFRKKIAAQKDLEKSQADYQQAKVLAQAAIGKLSAIGLEAAEIQQLQQENQSKPTVKVKAPISGVIVQCNVQLGQAVNAYDAMGSILDAEKVMVKGYFSPEESQLLKKGSLMRVLVKSGSESIVTGKLDEIIPGLDPLNRSVVVTGQFQTENHFPQVGMSVRVEVEAAIENAIIIPANAIQYEKESAMVFVKMGERHYEKRPVQVIKMVPEGMLISGGLKAGEKVAVSQVFSLKALSRFEEFAE
jgi:membrane fusion protein, heavy metal efflux system